MSRNLKISSANNKPGKLRGEDLQQLMNCSHVGAIFTDASADHPGPARRSFSSEELLHFSRLATIGKLSACFAHEVSNPLTLIRGHVRFVEDSLPLDHPLRNSFEVIERASRRIEEMARRMLDFSRRGKRRTESCEVAELISDALCLVEPYLKALCINVNVHPDPRLPRIDLDRSQMVQAVVNLLQNAADSMAQTGERVLSITTQVEGGAVQIAISDTGTGIAPGNMKQIFEPFFTTKGERGTGLGLFITKQVIEGHHGSITVETSGCGTTFVISLPL
jgi:two-component system NtrC family sensor kinase